MSKIRKVSDENLIHASDLFAEFTIQEEESEDLADDNQDVFAIADDTSSIAESQLMEQAREQAKKIIHDAREQAEVLREQAYKEGREQGESEGFQQAYEEHRKKLNQEIHALQKNIADIVQSVTREKEAIMEKYVDELKNIVLAICEKIIQTSIHSSGEIIKKIILSATDKMKKRQWAKIYITKCNTGVTMETDEQFLGALAKLSDNVKIIVMEKGEEGTCIVELPDEIIDASVSTQLENIKDVLNNARL